MQILQLLINVNFYLLNKVITSEQWQSIQSFSCYEFMTHM